MNGALPWEPAAHAPTSDRFEILGTLGRGGMGIVFAARDRETGLLVALKTLRRLDADGLLRFKREFRALAEVRHPNLVELKEFIWDQGHWFLSMELVVGTSFLERVRGAAPVPDLVRTCESAGPPVDPTVDDATTPAAPRPAAPGRLNPPRLRAALAQIARGLLALHDAGLVHRDIKPANVLVTPAGRAVLLDFGVIGEATERAPWREGPEDVVGTPAYMAPEQARGDRVGPAADWYAVGVMLYEALTGRRPFGGQAAGLLGKQLLEPAPPVKLEPSTPADLNDLCVALLGRDPEGRPTGRETLRRLSAEADVDPGLGRGSIPLLGRGRELAELETTALALRAGRGGVVLLEGESGIGKSSILQAFLGDLERHGDVLILSARCHDGESMPFCAVDGVMDELARYLAARPASDRAAIMPGRAELLARAFPVLAAVAAAPGSGPAEAPATDPEEQRRQLLAAARELFARLAAHRLTVVAIDDLQRADADSLALWHEVLRLPHRPALLFLGVVRTAARSAAMTPEQRPRLAEGGSRLEVGPLAPAAARALAEALLGGGAGQPLSSAAAIATAAAGHPLFIDVLAREQAGAEAPAASLEEVLWRRVLTLGAPARRLVEVVAVAGSPISHEALAAASATPLATVVPELAGLRAARLVRPSGGPARDTVETFHDRVREVVLDRLEAGARRALHGSLAAVLEPRGADPETLARHLRGSGEPARAARYAARAADEAARVLAFDRAAELYRQALELEVEGPTTVELHARRGEALANAGRGAQAAAALLTAARGCEPGRALDLRRRAGEQLVRTGHVERGFAVLRDVMAENRTPLAATRLGALASAVVSRALLRIRGHGAARPRPAPRAAAEARRISTALSVAISLNMVDTPRAYDLNLRIVRLSRAVGQPRERALALALAYSEADAESERLMGEATRLAREAGDPYTIGAVELGLAFRTYARGSFSEALAHSDSSEQLLRERCVGATFEIFMARWWAQLSLYYLGAIGEMARRNQELLRAADACDDLFARGLFRTGLPNFLWLARDDPDGAREEAEVAARLLFGRVESLRFLDLLARGQHDLYVGDSARAARTVRDRWSSVARSFAGRTQLVRIQMLHLRGRVALAGGRRLEAQADARRLGRDRRLFSKAVSILLLAGAEHLAGNLEGAAAELARAATQCERAEMKLYAAAARRRLGQLQGGDGGRALIAAADAVMTAEGIRAPARVTALLAPGFGA